MSNILTEEELKEMERLNRYPLKKLVASHRLLAERCRLLVIENEALNSENYILKEGESP